MTVAPRLQVTVTGDARRRHVVLAGRLDEAVRLEDAAPAWAAAEVTIDLDGVHLITSIGVRDWVRTLHVLAQHGARVVLTRCSEPMIEQINMIVLAKGAAEVASFHAPYQCTACGLDRSMVLEVAPHLATLRALEAPRLACPECRGAMEFVEIPERFFLFLLE